MDFGVNGLLSRGVPRKERDKRMKRMIEFVDDTMTRFEAQRLKIDKFKFHHTCYSEVTDNWVRRIDRWIDIVIRNNVQEITVLHNGFKESQPYLISQRILRAPHVRSLTLHGMGFMGDAASSSALLNLKSLQSLKIEYCPMDDRFFKRLIGACSTSLEFLSISRCSGIREIRISGLPNIKKVFFRRCESDMSPQLFQVEAPNLECFTYYASYYKCPVPHVAVAVNQSKNLKILTLGYLPMKGEWFEKFLSNFPMLEKLALEYCPALAVIKISNPLIKNLYFGGCRELIDISLGTPELTMFFYSMITDGEAAALPSITWMKSSPPRSSKCEAHFHFHSEKRTGPDWSFSSKLRESCNFFKHLSFSLDVITEDFRLDLGVEHAGNGMHKWSCTLERGRGASYLISGEHRFEVFLEKFEEIEKGRTAGGARTYGDHLI